MSIQTVRPERSHHRNPQRMEILCQRDPRWSGVQLGKSNVDVGHDGCYETSLVMLANALGANPHKFDPGTFARQAVYDANGMIDGVHAAQLLGLKMTGRVDWVANKEDDKAIADAIHDPARGVILHVDRARHFVLGWKVDEMGRILVADPWYGRVLDAKAVWHDIDGARFYAKA